jgi:arylsulfatase A-like enzyme
MTNIVLLVADTWRKKDFEQDRSIAPFLDSKAKEGLYLENFYTNSPWTVPAHASMFSGKLPSEHGTTTENTYFSEKNSLAEYARQNNLDTVAITENTLITEETGFSEGFDTFIQTTEDLGGETWKEIWQKDGNFEGRKEKYGYFFKESLKKGDIKSLHSFVSHLRDKFGNKESDYNPGKTERTLEISLNHLKEPEEKFIFANIMSVHSPYAFNEEQKQQYLKDEKKEDILDASQTKVLEDYLPEGFSDRKLEIRKKAYKASINYTDRQIKRFYEKAPEDTVFIVLGDHGELIGEYQQQGIKLIGHHLGTYKELIEVPCIIFDKNSDIELELEEKGLYSIRDIKEIIQHLTEEKDIEQNEIVNSEYFGRKGFIEQFNRKIPEGCEKIYNRKSFSLINSEIKYDLTSDGEYAWRTNTLTENEEIDIGQASELKSKAELLYGWRVQ